jgi:hypothetical protein
VIPSSPDKRYYASGWNAAHRGEPFDPGAFYDWREGWQDYQLAKATLPEKKLTTL